MRYPVDLMEVEKGFNIYFPIAELVRPTYEKLLKDDNQTAFPFWAKLWASGKAMSIFLQQEIKWIESKEVLEIGAGIGLPSFIIAKHASKVVISDHNVDAVELLQNNISHLGLTHVHAMCLDWNDFPMEIKADTILLSDINYDPSQFNPLMKLIKRFLSEGSTIIIATPQRIMGVPFAEALIPFIKRSFVQTVEENEKSIDIQMLILKNSVA